MASDFWDNLDLGGLLDGGDDSEGLLGYLSGSASDTSSPTISDLSLNDLSTYDSASDPALDFSFDFGDGYFNNDLAFSWDSDSVMDDTTLTGDTFENLFKPKPDDPSLLEDIGKLVGKVPGGVWDLMRDFGIGWLKQWLAGKNREDRSRGGGGGRGPTTSVTSSIPVGTRK